MNITSPLAEQFDDSSDWETVTDDTETAAAQDSPYDSSSDWETEVGDNCSTTREEDVENELAGTLHDSIIGHMNKSRSCVQQSFCNRTLRKQDHVDKYHQGDGASSTHLGHMQTGLTGEDDAIPEFSRDSKKGSGAGVDNDSITVDTEHVDSSDFYRGQNRKLSSVDGPDLSWSELMGRHKKRLGTADVQLTDQFPLKTGQQTEREASFTSSRTASTATSHSAISIPWEGSEDDDDAAVEELSFLNLAGVDTDLLGWFRETDDDDEHSDTDSQESDTSAAASSTGSLAETDVSESDEDEVDEVEEPSSMGICELLDIENASLGSGGTAKIVGQLRGPEAEGHDGIKVDATVADVDSPVSEMAGLSSMDLWELFHTTKVADLLPRLATIEPLKMSATDVMKELKKMKPDLTPRRRKTVSEGLQANAETMVDNIRARMHLGLKTSQYPWSSGKVKWLNHWANEWQEMGSTAVDLLRALHKMGDAELTALLPQEGYYKVNRRGRFNRAWAGVEPPPLPPAKKVWDGTPTGT